MEMFFQHRRDGSNSRAKELIALIRLHDVIHASDLFPDGFSGPPALAGGLFPHVGERAIGGNLPCLSGGNIERPLLNDFELVVVGPGFAHVLVQYDEDRPRSALAHALYDGRVMRITRGGGNHPSVVADTLLDEDSALELEDFAGLDFSQGRERLTPGASRGVGPPGATMAQGFNRQ
jgi:hypothetical protein